MILSEPYQKQVIRSLRGITFLVTQQQEALDRIEKKLDSYVAQVILPDEEDFALPLMSLNDVSILECKMQSSAEIKQKLVSLNEV